MQFNHLNNMHVFSDTSSLTTSCSKKRERASSFATGGVQLPSLFMLEHFTRFKSVKNLFKNLGTSGLPMAWEPFVQECSNTSAFNIFHQLYNCGLERIGHNYTWPNNLSLRRLFEYYEAALWTYAGVSLATKALTKDFIIGWHWIITSPSHTHTCKGRLQAKPCLQSSPLSN